MDWTRALYGDKAIHVPAWLVIQDSGPGMVSFVGASLVDTPKHPARYGSDHTHQLIVGELVIRPHTIKGSNAGVGMGLEGIASNPFVLTDGETIFDMNARDDEQR